MTEGPLDELPEGAEAAPQEFQDAVNAALTGFDAGTTTTRAFRVKATGRSTRPRACSFAGNDEFAEA